MCLIVQYYGYCGHEMIFIYYYMFKFYEDFYEYEQTGSI